MGNYFSDTSSHENFNNSPSPPITQNVIYDNTATQRYRRQTDDYRRQLDDLVRENRALKHYNQSLRNEQHKLNLKFEQLAQAQRNESRQHQPITASISTEHIKMYVDEMLQNSDINIYGFPDAIEKQIYRNVFNMLLNVLDHTLETSEIKLFGHKIIFDIQPLSESDDNIVSDPNTVSASARAAVEIPK